MLVHPAETGEPRECKAWLKQVVLRGVAVCVPETADYELRRERALCQRGYPVVRCRWRARAVGFDAVRLRVSGTPVRVVDEHLLVENSCGVRTRRFFARRGGLGELVDTSRLLSSYVHRAAAVSHRMPAAIRQPPTSLRHINRAGLSVRTLILLRACIKTSTARGDRFLSGRAIDRHPR